MSEQRGRDQWAADLEAKHGVPLDQIPSKVYVLHYEIPQVVKSVSAEPRQTQQGPWPSQNRR